MSYPSRTLPYVPEHVSIHLNARLRPLDRGDRYEDPLQEVLDERGLGAIDGGGTMMGASHEPTSCDIELMFEDDPRAGLPLVIEALESYGAPVGSYAHLDGGERIHFGVTEGLGLYLNGTDLPDEVYASEDINELVTQVSDALGDEGAMQSYWEGPTETALYLYGPSADRMRALLADVLAAHPLAERHRLVTLT